MRAVDYLINTRFWSTAILNPVKVSSRWCKLSCKPMREQVKSRHFSKWIGARRPYFQFLYKFIGIISYKQLGQLFWKLIWIYCYLLNITLILYKKYLTDIATNNSNVWFFKHQTLSELEKLDLIVLQIA